MVEEKLKKNIHIQKRKAQMVKSSTDHADAYTGKTDRGKTDRGKTYRGKTDTNKTDTDRR